MICNIPFRKMIIACPICLRQCALFFVLGLDFEVDVNNEMNQIIIKLKGINIKLANAGLNGGYKMEANDGSVYEANLVDLEHMAVDVLPPSKFVLFAAL